MTGCPRSSVGRKSDATAGAIVPRRDCYLKGIDPGIVAGSQQQGEPAWASSRVTFFQEARQPGPQALQAPLYVLELGDEVHRRLPIERSGAGLEHGQAPPQALQLLSVVHGGERTFA